jgi:hypothetical protein
LIERDYAVFRKFGANTLNEFQNMLLDPTCGKLRDKYAKIDSLVSRIDKLDSIKIAFDNIEHSGESPMQRYERSIDFFRQAAENDSIRKYSHLLYAEVIKRMDAGLTMSDYWAINALQNIGQDLKDLARSRTQEMFQEKFLQLSSKMDYDSILSFQALYPEIFPEDVASLLEKAKQKYRSSLLRKPDLDRYGAFVDRFGKDEYLTRRIKAKFRRYLLDSLDMPTFERYYKAFPEDDYELFGSIEDRLFMQFAENRCTERAMQYLKYFPKGKYAEAVIESINRLAENMAKEEQ